jgi:D-proline reductase (dithiol) PrdB
MEILENRDQWLAAFQEGWLKHYQTTGQFDWKIYNRPTNKVAPPGKGVDLSRSRLVLITSAGGYLRDSQEPFDAPNPFGDYTLRLFPTSTPLSALAFAHDHYDHTAVNQDPQVLVPLRHLENLVAEGRIGELAPTVISYSGYQPVATRVVDELIPAVLEAVKPPQPHAALLVPS